MRMRGNYRTSGNAENAKGVKMGDRDEYLAMDEAAREHDWFVKHGEPYIRWRNEGGRTGLCVGSGMVGEWDSATGKSLEGGRRWTTE